MVSLERHGPRRISAAGLVFLPRQPRAVRREGMSAAGMTEERYTRATYDLTLAAAGTLVQLNPDMTFVYVSGSCCGHPLTR